MAKPKSPVLEVRIRGPVADIAEDFRAGLLGAGYTPLTTVNKLRSVGYLSRWLEERELGPSDLAEERIEEYLRGRRAEGHDWEISRRALRPLLDLLAGRGMLPPPAPAGRVAAWAASALCPPALSPIAQSRRTSAPRLMAAGSRCRP